MNRRVEHLAPVLPANVLAIPKTQSAGTVIRIFSNDDVPAAAALFVRVYPEHRWDSQASCEAYIREVFFDNPWRDLEIPSWVATENGRLCGFYAVLPRRMLLHGRPIRVAVCCQLLMDPDNVNGLAALQLAQACIRGPQDLTIADGANAQAKHIWGALGGSTALLFSLHWTRLLRPARYALSLVDGTGAIARPFTIAARPLCAVADSLASRLPPNDFLRDGGDCTEAAIDPAAMTRLFPDVMRGVALQPAYDTESLAWLLSQAAQKKRHGELRGRMVLNNTHNPIGWYLYYLNPGATGEVLQIAAREGCFDQVIKRLMADAWSSGATALRGRLDPRFVQELSDRHCWLRREGTWTLFHSRRGDVLAAFDKGDAFLSRLDGEWWLRFHGG